jgi:hypothetical protein
VRKPLFLVQSRAEGTSEASVLCLAATAEPSRADDVTSAVLARAATSGAPGGTVVLALDGTVDADCLEALCSLQERLHALGMCLRLAVGPDEPRRQLRKEAVSRPVTSLAIHPTLRSALLATYAAYLGPGVVTAQVRAALAVPAEPLQAGPAMAVIEPDRSHSRKAAETGYQWWVVA